MDKRPLTDKFLFLSRLFLLLVAGAAISSCTIATIRPLDPVTGKAIIGNEDQQFNAANYVSQIWNAQVIPALQESANDINVVIDALRENRNSASQTYGRSDGRQPYSFLVTGSGTVTSVNTESRAGLALVDTTGDGEPDISLAIGPVIRGTALRDGLPFISFNQFTNQMEYAAVSNEMHALINSSVLAPLGEPESLAGKQVTFSGAFTLSDLDAIVVTPAILTVSG